MSCFKLPMSLCKQIQSVLTRFWWDLSPEVRKMCWISWDHLSKPKNAGGLGFREIVQFNDAMLGKLAWRLLKDPTSLLARVLFGRYCTQTSFLNAQCPSSASHGWRGVLVGRDLLSKGLGWALGSGNEASIWSDPWLSTTEPMRPVGPPTFETQNWRVNRLLLSGTDEWNVDIIRAVLPQYEATIRKLVPSAFLSQDEVVWLPNASGEYTTKSGYAVAKLHNGTTDDRAFQWNKCIWKVDTSPKIKHFLWKANSKALAVGSVLQSRGLTANPTCKWCGALETELHVMLQCLFASKVWDLLPSMHKPSAESTDSVATNSVEKWWPFRLQA